MQTAKGPASTAPTPGGQNQPVAHRPVTAILSIDTNLLFRAFNVDSPSHKTAYAWLRAIPQEEEVAISEFILAELYGLLHNPAVLQGVESAGILLESRRAGGPAAGVVAAVSDDVSRRQLISQGLAWHSTGPRRLCTRRTDEPKGKLLTS